MCPVKSNLLGPALLPDASDSLIRSPGARRGKRCGPKLPAELACMQNLRDSWDMFYRRMGRSWGGVTRDIPDLPCGSRVLELGCGSGKTIRGMIGKGWRIVAIDISRRAVEISRSIKDGVTVASQLGNPSTNSSKGITEEVELLTADGRLLPFRDEVFDAVFAFHVLGHLLETQRSVVTREIIRVTRSGGLVFFRGFSFDDFRAGGDEIERGTFIRGDGTITHYFTEDEVLDLFKPLLNLSVNTVRWRMRVGGADLIRSEIRAAFRKE
ncbi:MULTISPECIES: class I SAM-dependent methyltransferase [Methanothrix]|nr:MULTISPECIES: class I SAM-dependent methyltransferase [Methanothrix]